MNERNKRAFITGVYGQDGSYLAEYLLGLGYTVLGLVHESDNHNINRVYLDGKRNFSICVGDMEHIETFLPQLKEFSPHEVYNIAAVSDLKTAKEKPEYTIAINLTAFENIVEAVTTINPIVRIFQALSSRILNAHENGVINEGSSLSIPKNAYDEAKRDSLENVVRRYRARGFFITSGFLCNHESPRRGERFVTGKIAKYVARIAQGSNETLGIGNIESKRDWSFAGDVVRAMHATLQCETPYDYVIGSGELHTVKEFIETAFRVVSMDIAWTGEGADARGFDESGILRVEVIPEFYQTDDNPVVSDTGFIEAKTPWRRETSFEGLVKIMIQSELERGKETTE